MSSLKVVNSFNTSVGLDDSLLQVVELRTGASECRLTFDFARRLKDCDGLLDAEEIFRPAMLLLLGVRSISCDGAAYELNSTIVGHGAELTSEGGCVAFYFDLTGGSSETGFIVRLKIVARDFSLHSVERVDLTRREESGRGA